MPKGKDKKYHPEFLEFAAESPFPGRFVNETYQPKHGKCHDLRLTDGLQHPVTVIKAGRK